MEAAEGRKAPEAKKDAAFWSGELGGACGDLGTFVPLVVGAMTVAGLAPAGVLVGFGAFLVAAGLAFGVPLAVQPMKAVAAVLLTGGLGPGELAAAGLMTGAGRPHSRWRSTRRPGWLRAGPLRRAAARRSGRSAAAWDALPGSRAAGPDQSSAPSLPKRASTAATPSAMRRGR